MSKRLQIFDTLSFDTTKWYTDEDGNMRVPVIIARTGVLQYQYQDQNGELVTLREAKLPEELLTKQVLFSAEGKPVTDEHPPEMVNSNNYAQYAKGVFINPKIVKDAIHGEIVIYDSELQKDIKDGIKYQISPGFWSSIEFRKGEFDGDIYDAVQKDIYVNHIAIVKDGRAGHDVRIKLDSATVNEIKDQLSEASMSKKARKDEMSDKDKIDQYEEQVKKTEDRELEETEIKDQDMSEEDKNDQKSSDLEGEEKKGDEDMSMEEKIQMLMTENAMLKERLANSDSKKLDAAYMEARDIALQHVTDKRLNQYHDDANYYRKAVIDQAGFDSSKLSGKGEILGAFNVAKTVLVSQNTMTSNKDARLDSMYKTELQKAQEERIAAASAFEGKRPRGK